MRIDTKRLASDPGYWDELKAPEDATHACIYLGGKWQWMKVNLSGPFNYYWHQRFSEWHRQESEVGERIISRPQKPNAADQEKRILVETFVAAPGRDRIVMGGSERVMRHGDRVEIYLARDGGGKRDGYLSEVEFPSGFGVLITPDPDVDGVVIVRAESGEYRRVAKDNIKPARTKEQRQRDEVIAAAEHAIESRPEAVANSTHLEWLYDAGMLRKPEGGHEGN